MPEVDARSSPNRVLAWLLVGAFVLIAFLLGRESTRWGAPMADGDHTEPTAPPPAAAQAPAIEPETPAAQTVVEARFEDPETGYGGELRLERRPDGRIVLSNAGAPTAPTDTTANTPREAGEPSDQTSTAAYFQQMDAVRAGQEMGDPNAFAMGLVKAAFSGSTEGIDTLVADSVEIERQMQAITPPPAAAEYHQASLDALSEGRALLEDLQRAIKTQDVQALTAIASRAKALQTSTQRVERLERQLRPSP